MRKIILILLLIIPLCGCNKTETSEFDAVTANNRLAFFTDEFGDRYHVVWRGIHEAYNPETLWECEFFGNFRMNIMESSESIVGLVKQLENRTPYTLEPGKIIIEDRSFYYNYWFDGEGRLHIKSTKSTAIERICLLTIVGEPF